MDDLITSLKIYRRNSRLWEFIINNSTTPIAASAYSGTENIAGTGFILYKTKTGANIALAHFTVTDYYDDTDAGNNLVNPSSSTVLFNHLIQQDFFGDSSGGGVGVPTAFTDLSDTYASHAGRAGQFLMDTGTTITTVQSPFGTFRYQDLSNYVGDDNPPAGKLFVTSTAIVFGGGTASYVRLADPYSFANRPVEWLEAAVHSKGYTWQDNEVVGNENTYVKEIGDLVSKFFILDASDDYPYGQVVYMDKGMYLGGDETLLSSYRYNRLETFSAIGDPDFDE